MTNYSSKLSLNIILHVTILFAILSALFMLYISKLTSTLINNEVTHIVEKNIKNMLYDQDNKPIKLSASSLGINENMINMYTTLMIQPIKDMIENNQLIKGLKSQSNSLIDQLTSNIDSNIQKEIQANLDNINSQIDVQINNIIKNFPYSYYINIFSQKENISYTNNKNLFDNIKLFNVLLIIFLIFFIFISLISETLTITDVMGVIGENLVTFFFVGIIEIWFFMNVASKYIPSPPSLLFTSLFTSVKDTLSMNILPEIKL